MKPLLGTIAVASLLLGACYLYSASAVQSIERAYPAEGRFVTVEGTRLHYMDKGRGEAVVLIHGASANLWDFEASIAPRLTQTNRVLTFDRPGYGYSDRPVGDWVDPAHQSRLLRKALVKLGVERAILVGHSLGGAIVLAYALDYPDATAGIVLIGGAAYPWKGGVAWTNHMAMWPMLGSLFASTLVVPAARIMLDGAVEEVFAPNPPTPAYSERARVVLALRSGPFRSSAEDVLRLSPYLEVQSQRYQNLSMPLMVITGKEDTIVPAWNHAHRLAALLPQTRLVELERTGHTPHHVQPERVADLIADFAR